MATKTKTPPDTRLPSKPYDPTGTGGLRRSYQASLYDLFKKYNESLQPRVARLLNRTTEESGFLKEFTEKIDDTDSMVMKAGSPKIIDKHITLSYKRGKQVAASNPRLTRQSIIIPSILSRTDNLAIEDLKTRNFNLINDDTIKKTLLRVMTEDIRQGKGTVEMARDIRNNIIDIGKTRSKMIARTEIAFSYNSAIAKTYRDADIEQWQWLSALAETTCQECASRHGVIYDWGDEQPPIHPNCLCTMYPIVDRGFKK
jgi:SPP1 gp7 family putative phage head morphogenesis protein